MTKVKLILTKCPESRPTLLSINTLWRLCTANTHNGMIANIVKYTTQTNFPANPTYRLLE